MGSQTESDNSLEHLLTNSDTVKWIFMMMGEGEEAPVKRRVQVLPHGGKFNKDEINFESDQEYRRREAAVEATRQRMKELAVSQAEVNDQTGTSVKIKET